MTTEYQFINSSGIVALEGTLNPDPAAAASPTFTGTTTVANLVVTGTAGVTGQTTLVNLATTGNTTIGNAGSDTLGFYGHAATAQQTGVAVTAAGIHAALVALGLITA